MNDSAKLPPETKKSIFKINIAVVIFVISIFTVFVLWTLPTVVPPGRRRIAPKLASMNNLRNIGLAVVNYTSGHESNMPLGTTTDQQGKPLHSWMTAVVPYLDQVGLANQIKYEKPWNDPVNQHIFTTNIPVFINPSIEKTTDSKGYALTHYTANSRLFGVNKSYSLDEISAADGMAVTIMLGEINSKFPAWGSTSNFRDPAKGLGGGPDHFGSPYEKSVNVIFSNGSGKFLSKDIDPKILKALSTPDGGEPISRTEY
ncbi:DUF1559 domain-containing protein [uncultured Gimesia sp.]|uniref:DUF1559 family PulG-like putative transporter n=1 Tax=uncultured Gimesia sp. TaxID=1678688 RepID=UPI002626618A|nr:DUF1559 domain-containing protein [uncultured Gimesia sp.]